MTMVYMLVMTDGIYLYSCFFFFLMIRRPPRSTLFPTRRSSDLHAGGAAGEAPGPRGAGGELRPGRRSLCEGTRRRVRLPLRLQRRAGAARSGFLCAGPVGCHPPPLRGGT